MELIARIMSIATNQIRQAGVIYRLSLSIIAAYITAISAQIVIPLPYTPVPLTGQVFVIMLIAGLLGPVYGGLSQVIYVLLGALGLPWYAGGSAGLGYSITAGYLIGFIFGCVISGYLLHNIRFFRKNYLTTIIAMIIGLSVIYLAGTSYISLATGKGLAAAIKIGALPFILPDLLKIIVAAKIVRSINSRMSLISQKSYI